MGHGIEHWLGEAQTYIGMQYPSREVSANAVVEERIARDLDFYACDDLLERVSGLRGIFMDPHPG